MTPFVTISVECAEGLSVEELARALPHGQIGVTTVGASVRLAVTLYEPRAAVLITRREDGRKMQAPELMPDQIDAQMPRSTASFF